MEGRGRGWVGGRRPTAGRGGPAGGGAAAPGGGGTRRGAGGVARGGGAGPARGALGCGWLPSAGGGFLDIVADFSVYAGIILGLAIAVPGARLACVALLTAYYISGTAFLALSSLAERRRQRLGDERSLRFVGGLAEGTETIAVYILLFLLPQHATAIVWAFPPAVAVTPVQRVHNGLRLPRAPRPAEPAGIPPRWPMPNARATAPLPLRVSNPRHNGARGLPCPAR